MGAYSGTAVAYLRNKRIVISSHSFLGENDGGSVPNGWFEVVSEDVGVRELGELVEKSLLISENNVPMPDFKVPDPSVLRMYAAAGASSRSTFIRGNCCVGITRVGDAIELIPTRNIGRQGFEDLNESAIETSASAGPLELGAALRSAWRACL